MSSVIRKKLKLPGKEVQKQINQITKKKPLPKTQETPSTYQVHQEPFKGSGKIFVSGTTVHGTNTKFTQELQQNDQVTVQVNNAEESRKVILVLSDKSACINEPFSAEVNSEFQVHKPPLTVEQEKPEPKRKRKTALKNYEIRTKRGPWTYWSDEVVTKEELSKEELLNIRAQKVRDKFCWM